MAKLQSGTVVYGNLTVNTFANINGNLILGAQLYAGGSYGTNGQVLQNIGGTGVAWANPSSGSSIFNGTSNVTVLTSGSNVVISVGGSIIANIGASGLTIIGGLSAGTITGNGATLTGLPAGYSNVNAATYLPIYSGTVGASFVNSTGNVLAQAGVFNALGINGAITGTGYINTTANISTAQLNAGQINTTGNILSTGAIHNSLTVNGGITSTGYFNTSANISAAVGNFGNVSIASGGFININSIAPAGNAIVTLGNLTNQWSTIYGKATTAQYADLAEIYTSDKKYVPGTVLIFGGNKEVTISTLSHDPRVAGVVSTNPAYLMNSTESGVQVALTGRVPTRVKGPVAKGDRLVSSDQPGIAIVLDKTLYEPGCVIGKALEDITDDRVHTIEVVVGRV